MFRVVLRLTGFQRKRDHLLFEVVDVVQILRLHNRSIGAITFQPLTVNPDVLIYTHKVDTEGNKSDAVFMRFKLKGANQAPSPIASTDPQICTSCFDAIQWVPERPSSILVADSHTFGAFDVDAGLYLPFRKPTALFQNLQGGVLPSTCIGKVTGISTMAGSILFVDAASNSLRYIAPGAVLKDLLSVIGDYASCFGLRGGAESRPQHGQTIRGKSFTSALPVMKTVQLRLTEIASAAAKFLNKQRAIDARDNVHSSQFRDILNAQVMNIAATLDRVHAVQSFASANKAYAFHVPSTDEFLLSQITSLGVEHIFSTMNRDHGNISAKSFKQEFRAAGIEHIKKFLPPSVLGFVHYARSKSTWYPRLSQVEIPEEPAKKIFEQIVALRKAAHQTRYELEKRNKPAEIKLEVKVLQDFANEWQHMQQLRLRQRHKFNPGTTPIRAWAHRVPDVINTDDDDE